MKIWIILILGFTFLTGSMITVTAQEAAGEEKGIENSPESEGTPEGNSEGPQGFTEMFGQFQLDEEGLSGRYVSFGIEDGTVVDYSFVPEEEAIFSSISSTSDLFNDENTRMDGAVFHAELDGLHFMSHNNPTSMVHILYSGDEWVNVSFALEEGITLGEINENELPIEGLASEAWITIGTEDFAKEKGVLEINMTKGVMVSFYRSPYQTMSSFQENLKRAVSEGKVDGELQVMSKEGGDTESQHFPYQGKVEMQVKGSDEGKMLKVEVQSQEKAGKILMFKVQGQVLGDVEVGKVGVEFDGEKAEMVDSAEEVLNGNTTMCQYYLEKDDDGCYQAMVYVPSFSSHEITFITEDDTSDSPFLSFGLLILTLVFASAVAITLLIGRKK